MNKKGNKKKKIRVHISGRFRPDVLANEKSFFFLKWDGPTRLRKPVTPVAHDATVPDSCFICRDDDFHERVKNQDLKKNCAA